MILIMAVVLILTNTPAAKNSESRKQYSEDMQYSQKNHKIKYWYGGYNR